jgi:hypothetical protein
MGKFSFLFYQCVQASFPKQTKYDSIVEISVVDPDTAFQVNPDPVPDQKLGKIQLKKIYIFWVKNYNLLIPRPS